MLFWMFPSCLQELEDFIFKKKKEEKNRRSYNQIDFADEIVPICEF